MRILFVLLGWFFWYRLSLHDREGLLQRAILAVQQTVRLRSCSGVFRPLLPYQRWPQHSNWPVPLGSRNRSAIAGEQLQPDTLAAPPSIRLQGTRCVAVFKSDGASRKQSIISTNVATI
jgi:hypothetical protein